MEELKKIINESSLSQEDKDFLLDILSQNQNSELIEKLANILKEGNEVMLEILLETLRIRKNGTPEEVTQLEEGLKSLEQ